MIPIFSINNLTLTTRFSTQGFQPFSFPLIQHKATSESVQQNVSLIKQRLLIATTISLKSLLNKTQPNNSKRGIDKAFIGATSKLQILLSRQYLSQYANKQLHNKPD